MKLKICSLFLLLPLIFSGCGIYGFTGSNISPDIKTISIQTFYNNAPLGPSNMGQSFTEMIKDYYQQNTSLSLVDQNGDLQLEGYVADYKITPVSANASANGADVSTLSRITITVFASYLNTKDDEFDFEKKFSFYVDYNPNTTDLSSNEETLIEEIFDQIILDIFNASVANW